MPLLFVAAGPPGANIPAVTETVVATVSGVTLPRAGLSVALSYIGALLTGAGTTAVTIRCRRGVDTTGVIVPTTAVPTETAAATAGLAGGWVDTPGELANASYVITLQQTAAGAAGTSVAAFLQALVGTPN